MRKFNERGLEIGICGQAPSDFPDEFPPFLIDCGITSISVTPDTAIAVRGTVAEAERRAYIQSSDPLVSPDSRH